MLALLFMKFLEYVDSEVIKTTVTNNKESNSTSIFVALNMKNLTQFPVRDLNI